MPLSSFARRLAAALALMLVSALGPAWAAEGYYRYPALAGDQAVFTAEGDLWTVPAGGGPAARLTTHAAQETNPAISPDGTRVAFTATYDGPPEVYVMPLKGGAPKRLSFEGTRAVTVGWTPGGEVLYTTQAPTGPYSGRIVIAVEPETLARHPLPVAEANDAAVAADGRTLFFTRFGLSLSGDNQHAYRGGLLAQLWRYDLAGGGEAVRLVDPSHPDQPSNDRRPMVWQDRIYFLSDRDGHTNLWSMKADGSDRRQLTRHDDLSVRTASLDRGRILYQLGPDLRLYDLASGADAKLEISLVSDFDQQRRRLVKNPLDFFDHARFAPSGERLAVIARGRVVLLGLGASRRIEIATPRTSRVRDVAISPDGKWVYAILEAGGQAPLGADDPVAPQIWRYAADGSGEAKQLTQDDAGYRSELFLSPDGKWLAHTVRDGRLFLIDLDHDRSEVIDAAPSADHRRVVWSPDSKHLAFVRSDSSAERPQLFLHEPATKTSRRLTSDRYETSDPAFTPDGKWLYFLSDRRFEPSRPSPWGDRNMGPFFERRTLIYALALQQGARFPYRPKDELSAAKPAKEAEKSKESKESKEAEKAEKDKDAAAGDKAKPAKPEATPAVDWDGLADRLFEVPVPAGNYSRLQTDGKRLYFIDEPGGEQRPALKSVAIDSDDTTIQTFLANVQDVALSSDGKKLALRRWADEGKVGDLLIVDAGAKAPSDLDKARIRVGDWAIEIDPRAEWRQMFYDAWRLHRDVFFDQDMRGQDWLKVRAKFAPLVERVSDRDELNDLLAQMLAELGTMHSQIIPGDLRRAQDSGPAAFLGALLAREPEGARIAHIYRTDPELPAERSPLAQPGVDAREGDLITAINGVAVTNVADIAELLSNRAGQQILLSLKRPEPQAAEGQPKEREIKTIVIAIDQRRETSLRYSDWEESRRAVVETVGNGRIGYLHLRAMGKSDIATFAREFYAQVSRDGLIIDMRSNLGGNIDSWIIEKLLRRAWAYWIPRYGSGRYTNMQQAFRGHLAVLIDERTYSDGEAFAAGVKALGLAPLIGMRTAGAGVWLRDSSRLADRGMARVAEFPAFSMATGELLVENKGVEPDIMVENPPHATFLGEDKQLDTAIQHLLEKLKSDPIKPLR